MFADNMFCRALGCTHYRAGADTPFCMKHWTKLTLKSQRSIREHKDPRAVEKAQDELLRTAGTPGNGA